MWLRGPGRIYLAIAKFQDQVVWESVGFGIKSVSQRVRSNEPEWRNIGINQITDGCTLLPYAQKCWDAWMGRVPKGQACNPGNAIFLFYAASFLRKWAGGDEKVDASLQQEEFRQGLDADADLSFLVPEYVPRFLKKIQLEPAGEDDVPVNAELSKRKRRDELPGSGETATPWDILRAFTLNIKDDQQDTALHAANLVSTWTDRVITKEQLLAARVGQPFKPKYLGMKHASGWWTFLDPPCADLGALVVCDEKAKLNSELLKLDPTHQKIATKRPRLISNTAATSTSLHIGPQAGTVADTATTIDNVETSQPSTMEETGLGLSSGSSNNVDSIATPTLWPADEDIPPHLAIMRRAILGHPARHPARPKPESEILRDHRTDQQMTHLLGILQMGKSQSLTEFLFGEKE